MKITAEDETISVCIETKSEGLHFSEVVELFRGISAGLGYHPDTIKEQLPSEDELIEIIGEAIHEAVEYGKLC